MERLLRHCHPMYGLKYSTSLKLTLFFRQKMNSSKRAKVSDICLTGGVIADIPHYQATTKSFKDTVKSNRETGRS